MEQEVGCGGDGKRKRDFGKELQYLVGRVVIGFIEVVDQHFEFYAATILAQILSGNMEQVVNIDDVFFCRAVC